METYQTKVTITLEQTYGDDLDDLNAVRTVISSEMSDCSIHAWFSLFQQVLAMAGFGEEPIMRGGAQVAFNPCRSVEMMRRVASEYDLRLNEDLEESAPAPLLQLVD